MADNDNTSVEVKLEAPEIKDQDTLDAALAAEPVKTEAKPEETKPEPEKLETKETEGNLVFGKYKSLEDAQKAFGSIQARATKAEQALKELKKAQEQNNFEGIKGLEYDKQVEFLLGQIQELKAFKEELSNQLEAQGAEAVAAQEEASIDEFVRKNPLLVETGLDEEFKLIATHPSMQQYTLESIFNVRMKPKLEKLMGTKISVKERKLNSAAPKIEDDFTDVSKMSPKDYEKNRQKIFASIGVK